MMDLYEIDLRYKRVRWVDGFDSMAEIVAYLKDEADRDQSYTVGLLGSIHAVAFFACNELMLLTSGGEVWDDDGRTPRTH